MRPCKREESRHVAPLRDAWRGEAADIPEKHAAKDGEGREERQRDSVLEESGGRRDAEVMLARECIENAEGDSGIRGERHADVRRPEESAPEVASNAVPVTPGGSRSAPAAVRYGPRPEPLCGCPPRSD